jgi:S1-C subfamily serine protease
MRKQYTVIVSCLALVAIGGMVASSRPVVGVNPGDAAANPEQTAHAKTAVSTAPTSDPARNLVAMLGGAVATAPAATQPQVSLPDLVEQMKRSIVRVDVWGVYHDKGATSGKAAGEMCWQTGTGFVIGCRHVGGDNTTEDVECDVVTNQHVVTMTGDYYWTTPPKLLCSMYDVDITHPTIVGTDVLADLAVVRFRAHASKNKVPVAVNWADPSTARVGEEVAAIGYARDIQGPPTVTRGILSATRRTVFSDDDNAGFADLLQTDAAINHGNSGGPLLNMRREVTGVVTYLSPAQVSEDSANNVEVDDILGISYARSSRTAKLIVQQILASGKVARLDLGCKLTTLQEADFRFLGWPRAVMAGAANGPQSLATKVGLKPADMIVAVGSASARPTAPDESKETKVDSVGELNDALALRGNDACIWVRYIRPPAALATSAAAAAAAGQFHPAYTGGRTTDWAVLR